MTWDGVDRYKVNDQLTSLLVGFGVYDDDSDEWGEKVNDLTHLIADFIDGKDSKPITIAPEFLPTLEELAKERKPYVVIEGGLAQYSSDDVIIIDLDWIEDNDYDYETLETAEQALAHFQELGLGDCFDAERVEKAISRIKEVLGIPEDEASS